MHHIFIYNIAVSLTLKCLRLAIKANDSCDWHDLSTCLFGHSVNIFGYNDFSHILHYTKVPLWFHNYFGYITSCVCFLNLIN